MSGSAFTRAAIPLRKSAWSSTARIRITPSVGIWSGPSSEKSGCERTLRFYISESGGDRDLDLRAHHGLAPQSELCANSFRALAYSRKAPMAGACAGFEHLGINPNAIVANTKAKLLSRIPNLDFNQLCPRMPKCVAQEFARDSIQFVLHDWR